jgi:RNA polymerase sigma factor (sigma-70 family)
VRLTLGALDAESPKASTPSDLETHLDALEQLDPRKVEVVRLRVFWGLDNEEIADIVGISRATVERDWAFSKAWLTARLKA